MKRRRLPSDPATQLATALILHFVAGLNKPSITPEGGRRCLLPGSRASVKARSRYQPATLLEEDAAPSCPGGHPAILLSHRLVV